MSFAGQTYDEANDRLLQKFFLLDTSTNDRGWAVSPKTIDLYVRTFIGTPFTVVRNKYDTLVHDYHPFSPKAAATVQDHIAYAQRYAVGKIVDVTSESQTYPNNQEVRTWFAIVEINDPDVKQ